jgi:hypothetical protein
MSKSGMFLFVIAIGLVPTGCQPQVEGYELGNRSSKSSTKMQKSLQEETQKLKAARSEQLTKNNKN